MTGLDSTPRVLVTNAEQRAVLAACRGLHAGGFAVGAVAERRPAAGLWSRSCRERLGRTPPATDARALVERLASVTSGRGYRLVLPGTDASLFAVSRHRDLLDGVVETALPDHAQVIKAFDRIALFDAASKSGFDCPPFRVCTDQAEALSAASTLGFPVMVKPVHAVVESPTGLVRRQSVRVDGSEALAEVGFDHPGGFVLQTHEAGRVASFSGVYAGGRLVASALSRYLRTWRPEWGDATFAITLTPSRELVAALESLIERLGWEGIFQLEFIERADGSLAPIDLNPRAYGSMGHAIDAGANLPAAWARWALGDPAEPVIARPGVPYRWGDSDLRHGLWQLRHRGVRAALRVARPTRGTVHAYARWDDPGPSIARLGELRTAATRRRAGRRARPG